MTADRIFTVRRFLKVISLLLDGITANYGCPLSSNIANFLDNLFVSRFQLCVANRLPMTS